MAIFDGDRRTHDAYAHSETTMLSVSRADLQKILTQHVELYEALLRLHARRIRQLFGLVEDLNTLPLRARLAKQLAHLVRSYGVRRWQDGRRCAHRLHGAQKETAQLARCVAPAVTQELKRWSVRGVIPRRPARLVDAHREA